MGRQIKYLKQGFQNDITKCKHCYRLNNTLSVNNRDCIPCTTESGQVGQIGRPATTAKELNYIEIFLMHIVTISANNILPPSFEFLYA